ncbi:cutinase-domain-containing protein [Ascobolus immersus RN42]|uniref:Cutinase n=1 Tax=Ascobolus immersus RN42 TaxID=1160509 RepID=A0A3N4I719_ASCIM|nr:cutinase-domain-containing protein [Ascobolus immersus RN42]
MRAATLLSLFTAVVSVLAVPTPIENVPTATSSGIDLTNISIDSAFLEKLELMFAGKYDPFNPSVGVEDSTLVKRAGTTQTELIDGKCGSVIFIYARGTTQEGNIGQNPGVALTAALKSAISNTIIQGVLPYKADVAGYLAGGSAEGASAMASLTARAASQCPSAKIVLSGYSQGAQVVRKAAAQINSSLHGRISAIVTFGDPKKGDAYPGALNNKNLVICNSGDLICDGIPLPIGSHSGTEYEKRIPEAIAYIKARV